MVEQRLEDHCATDLIEQEKLAERLKEKQAASPALRPQQQYEDKKATQDIEAEKKKQQKKNQNQHTEKPKQKKKTGRRKK